MNRITILFIIFFASCTMPEFNRYPGQELPAIPESFRGNCKIKLNQRINKWSDSVEISITDKKFYFITPYSSGKNGSYKIDSVGLSDTFKVSQSENRFFVSLKNSDSSWAVFLIQQKGKRKLLFHPVMHSTESYFNCINGSNKFYEMSEVQLENYCKKVPTKKNSIQLKKLRK